MKKSLLLFTAIASFVGFAGTAACHMPVAPYSSTNNCVGNVDSCQADFRLPECVWDGSLYTSAFVGFNGFKAHSKGEAAHLSFKDGGVGLIAFGYQYSAFRTEIEVSYRYNDLKKTTYLHLSLPIKGHVQSIGVLANAYYDFKNSTRFTPYVGVGAGFAHVKGKYSVDNKFFGEHSIKVDAKRHESANRFAWQVIAGVSTPVTDHIDLGIEYRYFRIHDVARNQSVGVSAKYFF